MLNINKISPLTITPSFITHFAAADPNLGYGIGKIVREAFEHLFFSQDKTTLSTEDIVQIKPNLSENDLQKRMKRTTQQTGSSQASFNLTSLNGTNGFSVYGFDSNDHLGTSVSSAGDLNNDGITDLVLGADYASPDGLGHAGAAYVLLGNKNGWQASFNLTTLNGTNGFSLYGHALDDALGSSVSSAGDFNGDGITDLVLGAYGASPGGHSAAGAAYVLFGSKASWSASFNLTSLNGTNGFSVYGPVSLDYLGNSVNSADDLNGDGITDLVLGAYAASPGGLANAGAAYVLFGSKASWPASFNLNSLNGTNGFSVYGSASRDQLGTSVNSAGDLNGDGITDLVLGAYAASPGGLANAGAAYVLFGSNASWPVSFNLTSLNGTNGFSVFGSAPDDYLGPSVSCAGDLNGDGITDLVLGAYYVSPGGGANTGAAYVLFGSKASWPVSFNLNSLNGTNGFSVYGLASGDVLGNSVSSAGDLNDDGITDLVLGAYGASPGGVNQAGAAYVLFGCKTSWPASFNLTSLNGTNGFSVYGSAPKDFLGSSVSSAGDLNGDGITDLVLGADSVSPGGLAQAGAAYVLFGSRAPFINSPFTAPLMIPASIQATPTKIFIPSSTIFSPAISANSPTNSLIPGSMISPSPIPPSPVSTVPSTPILFTPSFAFSTNSPTNSLIPGSMISPSPIPPSPVSTVPSTPILFTPSFAFSTNSPTNSLIPGSMISPSPIPPSPVSTVPSTPILFTPSFAFSTNSPTNSLIPGFSGSSSATVGIAAGVTSAGVVMIVAGVIVLLWRKKKGCFAPSERSTPIDHHDLEDARSITTKTFE